MSMATVWMLPVSMPAKQFFQTIQIHCFMQAIVDSFANQRMIGNANFSGQIFRACHLIGKHGSEQIVRAHALDGRGNLYRPRIAESPALGRHSSASGL